MAMHEAKRRKSEGRVNVMGQERLDMHVGVGFEGMGHIQEEIFAMGFEMDLEVQKGRKEIVVGKCKGKE